MKNDDHDDSASDKNRYTTLIGEKVQLFDNLQPLCENTFVLQKPANQAAA